MDYARSFTRGFLLVGLVYFAGARPAAAETEAPWPAAVQDFVEPRPGEHPRLFFRKADVPKLRRRATETKEGRAIVARLRVLLGNDGESLPDHWNERYPVNIGAKGPKEAPVGAFTFAHPAGYGMLYQLTGEEKYADLARRGLERMFDGDLYKVTADVIAKERGKMWKPRGPRFEGKDPADVVLRYGQPDRDERYTWTSPGAKLRIGPMMLAVAMAYDLCYDAWDEAFRRRVVKEIVDYDHLPVDYDPYAEGHKGRATMDKVVHCSMPPTSNHFGAYIGGAGAALLAVRGDQGADRKRVDAWLATIEKQTIRLMTEGFGDHGFFSEGHGPSHMAVNTAFVPFLQAARVAWGKDFITPRPHCQWLTLRWAMEVIPGADKPWYPNFHPSSYGPDYVARGNLSDGGEWAQGFGALADDDQRAAMLWMYLHAIERDRPLVKYDAWVYPHRAVLALINWPIGIEPKDPGEVISHVNADEYMGHYMFRKQWADANDLYFTFFLNPHAKHGYVKGPRGGNFAFYGYGIRSRWRWGPPQPPQPRKVTYFQPQANGGGVLSFQTGPNARVTSIAVDYSGKSGAGGVVIFANPWFTAADRTKTHWNALKPSQRKDRKAAVTFHDVEVDGVPWFVMILQEGEPPKPTVAGKALKIGSQTYRFDGKKLIMGAR